MNKGSSIAAYRRLSLLLFSLSLVLASASIGFARLQIGAYGLASSLSPTFFVALFLLTLSFLIAVRFNSRNSPLLFAQLIVLVVLLYLMPALLEKTARFAPSYLVYGSTDYTLQHGHLDFSFSTIGAQYQRWPGITLLGASLMQITNLSSESILIGFPVAFELLCLPVLYSILSAVSDNRRLVWIGLWLYFVAGWINRAYYSGQALGYLLFLVVVFVILSLALSKGRLRPKTKAAIPIVLVVLFIALAVSHLLSAIVAGACLVILYILFRAFRIRGAGRFGFIIPVSLVAIAVWVFVFGGNAMFGDILQGPAGRFQLLNFGAILKSTFQVPFLGGEEHARIMLLRAIYTGAFCALALLGLVYTIIKGRMSLGSILMLGLLLGTCSAAVLVGSYGGESVYRAFEFSLLFLAFFAAKTLGSKALSILLIVFLIVSPVLFVMCAYANEKADYVSPAEIRGVDFFYDHLSDDATVHSLWPRIWDYRDIERGHWVPLDMGALCSGQGEGCFLLGKRDLETREFLEGDLRTDVDDLRSNFESSCRVRVYTSDGFELYK